MMGKGAAVQDTITSYWAMTSPIMSSLKGVAAKASAKPCARASVRLAIVVARLGAGKVRGAQLDHSPALMNSTPLIRHALENALSQMHRRRRHRHHGGANRIWSAPLGHRKGALEQLMERGASVPTASA